MKSWVRFTAAALAVGVAVPLLGVVSPAVAASFDQIIDLWNYKLLKSGTELQAAMGPAARAAWSAQTSRVATQSASAYSIASATSGLTNVHPDPIYIRPQDLPQIKPVGGFKNYVPTYTGLGLNKPIGVGAATVAMVAFEYRADIANGVTRLVGFSDATDLVCSDNAFAGGNFFNFLTGQDCDAWRMSQAAIAEANSDVDPNAMQTGWLCRASAPGVCVRLAGMRSGYIGDPNGTYYKVDMQGVSVTGDSPPLAVERFVAGSWGIGSQWIGTASGTGARNNCRALWGVDTWCMISNIDYPLSRIRWGNPAVDGNSVADVVPVEADPPRYFVCDYTGSDGNHYTANSESFREGEGVTAPIICPALPAGVSSVHMKVTLMGGPDPLVLEDVDALADPLGDGSDTNGVTTAYCDTNVCVLELMDLRSNKSCFDEGDACDGWLRSPTRDADYRCFYGGVEQDFKQCYVYAQVFNTAKRLAGEPYADPKTGEDAGTKSGLSIDELTMANSPRPAAFGRNCFGGDWGASNPVNWVLRPIQCALEWAFAARPAVVTANAEVVSSAWENTAPGEVVAVVGAWGFPAGSTGCAGPAVNIPFLGLSGYPLSACSGTLLAPMASAVKTMLSVMLVLGGAFVIVRMVSGVIGYRGIDE